MFSCDAVTPLDCDLRHSPAPATPWRNRPGGDHASLGLALALGRSVWWFPAHCEWGANPTTGLSAAHPTAATHVDPVPLLAP
jgi:hypothetical protein